MDASVLTKRIVTYQMRIQATKDIYPMMANMCIYVKMLVNGNTRPLILVAIICLVI